ncbi:MAG: ATP-binding protein, partial [Gammaproteobacteria bacterium]|nr:ATP-binding protein [Gammaproteobacteria bacterium]
KPHTNTVEIHIEDDGNGIPEHAQDDIIKRGKRVDTQVDGHGLGLAIVSDIVSAYRGEIRLEKSRLGGANIIIELPKH